MSTPRPRPRRYPRTPIERDSPQDAPSVQLAALDAVNLFWRNAACEHCRARTPHFHQNGDGYIFGPVGGGMVVGDYHQSWGPLTDHDEELPGYEFSRRGRASARAAQEDS